jgi:hypothetical protein
MFQLFFIGNSRILGIYFLLLGLGVIRQYPKESEAQEKWQKKVGPLLVVMGGVMIGMGILMIVSRWANMR